jgi:predicted phosphodiesterase
MKSLTVSILSDLHFDSHFPITAAPPTEEAVRRVFDPIFKTPANLLVIAGDLSHYNHQSRQLIKWLRRLYFRHIVCVLGNHDYFLVNRIMQDDYDMNSFNRVQEMRDKLNSIDGVYCLNGYVVEIEGVRFGGCDSWYDGQYLLKNLNPRGTYSMGRSRELWHYTMNDAAYIFGIQRFDEIWDIEKPKIEAVYQKCDVMITHVSPSIIPEHIPDIHFRRDDATSFFTFDGEEYVKNTTAKVWIYGHTHTPNDYEWHGVRLIANQLGYPGEIKNVREKRINIARNKVI